MARVQWGLGAVVVLLGLLVHAGGVLERAELALFDAKSRVFGFFAPGLSDEVVVIGIDDPTLETVLGWPMNRGLLGRAISELERAGASVVALDVLLNRPGRDGAEADAALAASVGTRRRTVLAASFIPAEERIAAADDKARVVPLGTVLDALEREPGVDPDRLRAVLLPGSVGAGPEADDFRARLEKARAVIELVAGSSAPTGGGLGRWPAATGLEPPVPVIARASGRLATVNFGGGDADGGVRRIPLWVESRGRMFPTLGLHAALVHLGIPVDAVKVSAKETGMPLPGGGEIRLPTHRAVLKDLARGEAVDGLLLVTWPKGGFGGWRSQFEVRGADGRVAESMLTLGSVLDPIATIGPNIQKNVAAMDEGLLAASGAFGLLDSGFRARAESLAAMSPLDQGWPEAYSQQAAAWSRAVRDGASLLDQATSAVGDSPLTVEESAQLEALRQVVERAPAVMKEINLGLERIRRWREEELPRRVKGRICLIGWTATGAIADYVATSIDSRTPGVMVHAAVASSILKQAQSAAILAPAPGWLSVLAIIGLGLAGTGIAVRLSVLASPLVLLAGAAGWFAIDGLVLFDRLNLVLAEAVPLLTMAATWLTVMLHRLLIEQRGRRQTEARFRQYVSPDVVDILVNNPGLNSMAPQRRELSILFSDIRGFTTLAERLGTEGTFNLLSRYLAAMTEVLQSTRATLDKYLGDGIMAFWGAPLEDPQHALHAAEASLRMLDELDRLNAAGAFGEAGALSIRIGLASGEVNVGDFGNPPAKSAYTVIGDAVNLAARLESANKQLGSTILINERLRSGLPGSMRVRPLGRVNVVGKASAETLFELVAHRQPRGARTDEWIGLTERAVSAFQSRDFAGCRQALDLLENEFHDASLADLYRQAMAGAEADAVSSLGEGFSGCIVLREK